MIVTQRRGFGAARNNATTTSPRYGISPQLAPSVGTAMDKKCLNSPIVGSPQKPSTSADRGKM